MKSWKVPGESVGDTFLPDDNQRDGNFMSTSHVLKGTGWRLAALGQVTGMKELQHLWRAKEAQPRPAFVPASLPKIQNTKYTPCA